MGIPNALVRLLQSGSVPKCVAGAHFGHANKNAINFEELHSQIEVLALSAIATVATGSSAGKTACLASAAAEASVRLTLLDKDEGGRRDGRSMLPCRLLHTSLQPKETFATRLLALRLLEAFTRGNLHGTATLRTIIHRNIVAVLRNDLKAVSQSSADTLPPEIFAGLLDALGSVLLLLPADTPALAAQAKATGQRVERKHAISRCQSTAPSTTAVVSVPELVKWIYERYHKCDCIVLSLTRFIGRICCENSFVHNEQWTVTCRKTFAIVLSEEVLDTAAACCSPQHPTEVRTMAFAALWFILHRSERARAYFKNKKQNQDFDFLRLKAKLLDDSNNSNDILSPDVVLSSIHAEKMVYSLIHEK
jgi:hypothetical protein